MTVTAPLRRPTANIPSATQPPRATALAGKKSPKRAPRKLTMDEHVALLAARHEAAKQLAAKTANTLLGAQWVRRLTSNLVPPSKGWHAALALADAKGPRGNLEHHEIPKAFLRGISPSAVV